MYNQNYLAHYGVIGMKWGKHKTRIVTTAKDYVRKSIDDEKAYREKLTNITKNKYMNRSDRKRFEYRNKNLAGRLGENATKAIVKTVVRDILTGEIANYSNMNGYQLKKKLGKIAVNAVSNTVVNDALAKSAASRYKDDGKRLTGKKYRQGLFTKEEKIEMGIKTAQRAAFVAALVLPMAARDARKKRSANEAAFKKMGSRILSEKVANFVEDVSYNIH